MFSLRHCTVIPLHSMQHETLWPDKTRPRGCKRIPGAAPFCCSGKLRLLGSMSGGRGPKDSPIDPAVVDHWVLKNCSARFALLQDRAGPVLGSGWCTPGSPLPDMGQDR